MKFKKKIISWGDGPKNKWVGPGGNRREAVGHDNKETKYAVLWSCHQGTEPLHPPPIGMHW